jgi:hypothetical protein
MIELRWFVTVDKTRCESLGGKLEKVLQYRSLRIEQGVTTSGVIGLPYQTETWSEWKTVPVEGP